jgi:ankyrin repeat protein
MSVFAQTIIDNDVKQFDRLVSSVNVNARLPVDNRAPALVFAAAHMRHEIVERLLKAGANIDGVDDEQQTACHIAADGGDAMVDVMSVLLAHRPNLTLVNGVGFTSLQVSFRLDANYRISTMLIEAGAPLDLAANERDLCELAGSSTAAIQALVNRGVVIRDLRDRDGRTPLHCATMLRHRDPSAVLNMLINDCGVDLSARTTGGSTCTQLAAFNGFAGGAACSHLGRRRRQRCQPRGRVVAIVLDYCIERL